MKNGTKAKLEIAVDFTASCIWHVFEGLYEWIKYVGKNWVAEWQSAAKDWKIASAMPD